MKKHENFVLKPVLLCLQCNRNSVIGHLEIELNNTFITVEGHYFV